MFVPRPRVILHADVDAFFASVAQRDDPSLRGLPVIVGGGVVMAASYEARRFGVRSGMGGSRARRLCPQAVVVGSQWSAYVEASKAVFAVFEQTAPVVEALSIEEAFLDISSLATTTGEAREVGRRLREDVREQAGLPITVGIGRTNDRSQMVRPAGVGTGSPPGARDIDKTPGTPAYGLDRALALQAEEISGSQPGSRQLPRPLPGRYRYGVLGGGSASTQPL